MTYVILQVKEDPIYVKTRWTWWKWGKNWPFSRGHMGSDDARDLRMAIMCSAKPSGSRDFLSEVWGGPQGVRGQGVQAQVEATDVRLNPDVALQHTYIPALGKLRQEDHALEPKPELHTETVYKKLDSPNSQAPACPTQVELDQQGCPP